VIAKHIPRDKPGSFTDLAKYVAAAKEPGEKLDDLWIINANAGETIEDLDLAIREVEAQQALNKRVKTDKQYHLMVSFPEGEKPTPEAMRDMEREFAKALGFTDHPRVVGTHIDTNNFHMHVAYSRIHPKTFKAHSPEWDYRALEKTSRAMEQKYGLKVDLGRADKQEADRKPHAARDKEAHTWEQSFHGYVNEHKDRLMKARSKAKNWQDLHAAFAKYDLTLVKRGNGLVIGTGPNSENGKKHIKASSLDRSFSKAALEKQFGSYKRPEKAQERAKPISRYKRSPTTRHPLQGRLWRQYIGQRHKRPSLVGKAFKTWREFLMMGIDDPLAMAIVIFHKEMMKTVLKSRPHSPAPFAPTIPTAASVAPTIDGAKNIQKPKPKPPKNMQKKTVKKGTRRGFGIE